MFNNMVIRKCLLPAAVAVVTEVKSASNTKSDENKDSVCRPSELPIYSSDQQLGNVAVQETKEPNIIEVSFRNIRQVLFKYSEEFKAYEKVAQDSFTESKQNIEWLVDYLRQEDNSLPKAGAIGIGALTGLIFGLRGGIFKRTLYAATGALGMASVCYPKEASEYSQVGAAEGKKILTIAYNFVYGVKKDEPPLELPSLPKLPTNVSDLWDSIKNQTSSIFSDQASQDVNTPETKSKSAK
ncbi:MICOS complex subunit MIC27 isoform X3 [Sitophilus oryzae]|uniref:MICOS complex subunit n=1 Tax=Sitophilus oryzae TaxID=7048 RepID=A0A6J2XLW6_SITOR|nr:MICOS complex subunit MIC27 isoform X3 [Sitophilus oryzae]